MGRFHRAVSLVLTLVAFFGFGLTAAISWADIMDDHKCGYMGEQVSLHPCNCFNKPPHDYDMCEKAIPANPEVNLAPNIMCIFEEDEECTHFSTPNVYNCGAVMLCNIVCDQDDASETNPRSCSPTDKGNCEKAYGNCTMSQ